MVAAFASREMSQLAQALGEAEDVLGTLPLTEEVRGLHTRLSALKTVTLGIVRNVPRLTPSQRSHVVVEAIALARTVEEVGRGSLKIRLDR
ncbi:MAG TPA: hypothetical protein VGI39_10350 [Polyangiaceae bacterium]|jgi:hypothetical protein